MPRISRPDPHLIVVKESYFTEDPNDDHWCVWSQRSGRKVLNVDSFEDGKRYVEKACHPFAVRWSAGMATMESHPVER